jgi:hypothetical protein
MGVQVNKTGTDHCTGRVDDRDLFPCLDGRCDCGDAIAGDQDVSYGVKLLGGIEDTATPKQQNGDRPHEHSFPLWTTSNSARLRFFPQR